MTEEEAVRVIGEGLKGDLFDGLQKLLFIPGTAPHHFP
jgi:hypothetical protein